jgi:hypothetical protein
MLVTTKPTICGNFSDGDLAESSPNGGYLKLFELELFEPFENLSYLIDTGLKLVILFYQMDNM